ncbi:hypothetical protein ACQP1P_38710 [Dactylosporangium sp. CA-052675]|uniref:hypothetical protein n=1 Tax=Dactylosporangium sp. CA-052675 TaxID=3239927 RepID=UPI003D8FA830
MTTDPTEPVMATPAEPRVPLPPHTPGAGWERVRAMGLAPELTAEDEAAADRLLATLPDDHTRVRDQALADPEVREAYIEARVQAAYKRGKAEGVAEGKRLTIAAIAEMLDSYAGTVLNPSSAAELVREWGGSDAA